MSLRSSVFGLTKIRWIVTEFKGSDKVFVKAEKFRGMSNKDLITSLEIGVEVLKFRELKRSEVYRLVCLNREVTGVVEGNLARLFTE